MLRIFFFEMGQRIGFRRHAAQHAKDELQEEGRPDRAALHEMPKHRQMADVVTFKFEPRAAHLAHLMKNMSYVLGCILENKIVRVFEERPFPRMFPVLDPRGHRVKGEVHRTHVQAAHLGAEPFRRGEALVQRHHRRAAGGHVDDRIAALPDCRQEPRPMGGIGRWPAGVGVAGMQMQDRRASLGRVDGRSRDLIAGDRQVGRHRRRVDRAGDGAGDDDLRHHSAVTVKGAMASVR